MRRDPYANLLRDSRGLRRDQAAAREAWFAGLSSTTKEQTLFEFEMLLKGIGTFGNGRNLPGPPRRSPSVAHDFHEEQRLLGETVQRTIELIRQLLEDKDKTYKFSRYLETVLEEDSERTRVVKDHLTQDAPLDSLFVLRDGLTSIAEIIEGLLRLGRVSHRLHVAVHTQLIREIGRNAFFNPLVALEFRGEFDRIRRPEVLEALDRVPSESAHRVAVLAFLTLFRGLRYLDLVDFYASEMPERRLGYIVLSAFRSDLRALTRFIGQRAGSVMAEGFEQELLSISAASLGPEGAALERVSHTLVSLRRTLEAVANSLRIEIRKVFERDLPAPEEARSANGLPAHLVVGTATLRAALLQAIASVTSELRPGEAEADFRFDPYLQRSTSDRLRRDVWIFSQVLRAFVAKAEATEVDTTRWSAPASFQFVQEFLGHFRAIGYQLVRKNDYDRLEPFLRALAVLRAIDVLDGNRLRVAARECKRLSQHLEALFRRVNGRAELEDLPFDKRAAAETLRIYLGAA